jgi:hypothetical protein
MSEMKQINVQRLLGLLQGCHSILGLCWPKPGVPQMSGARIFIGTKPFFALEDGIRQTNSEFESLSQFNNMQTARAAWHLVTRIVAQFRILGRNSEAKAIDPAFNLIYLATGLLYHHVSNIFSVVPIPVQPYATVETLEKLLRDCSWQQGNDKTETEEMLKSLADNLHKSLIELQS